jgi:hypothetical protein
MAWRPRLVAREFAVVHGATELALPEGAHDLAGSNDGSVEHSQQARDGLPNAPPGCGFREQPH